MEIIRSVEAYRADAWQRTPSGLLVPTSATKVESRPTCVDLFCGAGGFSLGVMQAGMKIVAACDNDPAASATYMYNLGTRPINLVCLSQEDEERLEKFLENHFTGKPNGNGIITHMAVAGGNTPNVLKEDLGLACPNFFFGDIRKLTGEMIFEATGLGPGEISCVIGGPPCQGFSVGGKRDVVDPRNSMVFEFARIVLEIQPKTMVMENVPGILSMVTPDGLPVVDVLCRILEDGGWGTVEAIKRSLAASSGARALLRRNKKDKEKPQEEHKEMAEQMPLFATY